MSFLFFFFILFVINFIFSYLFARAVYNRCIPFYTKLAFKNDKGDEVDLHENYNVFHPQDKLSFSQLWFEGFFCFIPKAVLSVVVCSTMIIVLNIIPLIYKHTDTDINQWKILKSTIHFFAKIFLYLQGIKLNYKKKNCEEVYKKYLGDDYDFKDNKYSLVISNHTGFYEVVICMLIHGGGFIAKKDVKDYYFVGRIATAIHCLYIDRVSSKERKQIFEEIEKRQKGYYEGKIHPPLILFPEGTTTCGRNILKFKKGAFYSLLPIKPQFINIYHESDYHLTSGALDVTTVYFRNLCHTIEPMYIIDMPVIRPTKFMFDNYSNLGHEKWEVYAEVVRKIYCELFGLVESDLGKRDCMRYEKAAYQHVYNPKETMFGRSNNLYMSDMSDVDPKFKVE